MANHITHSFKQNKMVYYHHSPPKNAKGKTTCGEGPMFFNVGWVEPSKPPMQFMFPHPNH